MRITLEASDILALLSKHFGKTIQPAQVDFRLDPLEIEVSGVDPVTPPAQQPTPVHRSAERVVEDEGESMEDTLKRAREIESIARRGNYVR
jgi:hypothetical protein